MKQYGVREPETGSRRVSVKDRKSGPTVGSESPQFGLGTDGPETLNYPFEGRSSV